MHPCDIVDDSTLSLLSTSVSSSSSPSSSSSTSSSTSTSTSITIPRKRATQQQHQDQFEAVVTTGTQTALSTISNRTSRTTSNTGMPRSRSPSTVGITTSQTSSSRTPTTTTSSIGAVAAPISFPNDSHFLHSYYQSNNRRTGLEYTNFQSLLDTIQRGNDEYKYNKDKQIRIDNIQPQRGRPNLPHTRSKMSTKRNRSTNWSFQWRVLIAMLVVTIIFLATSEFVILTRIYDYVSTIDYVSSISPRKLATNNFTRQFYQTNRINLGNTTVQVDLVNSVHHRQGQRTVFLEYDSVQQPLSIGLIKRMLVRRQQQLIRRPLKRYLGLHQSTQQQHQFVEKLLEENTIDNKQQYESYVIDSASPDYGGLIMESSIWDDIFHPRTIQIDDGEHYHNERTEQLVWIDDNTFENHSQIYDVEDYYFYDDIEPMYGEEECQRPKWSYEIYPNCNQFHEAFQFHYHPDELDITATDVLSLKQNTTSKPFIKYIDHGFFRDSYLFDYGNTNATQETADTVVLKSLRYWHVVDPYNVHKINNEAIVMDRLTSSPLIVTMYGHCGTSIAVERGYEIYDTIVPYRDNGRRSWNNLGRIRQSDLDVLQNNAGDVVPMNKLSNEDKLDIAIRMAESIAELHGYVGGVITMDDIEVHQWLSTTQLHVDSKEGIKRIHPPSIKLNDFGNSKFLKFNTETQEYCNYWASFYGTFRAPEEYGDGSHVDESVDVWPVGNLVFTLLTGLFPYYYTKNESSIQYLTQKGPPYIDHRYHNHSYIERRLYTAMKQCHKVIPADRKSIFDIVQYLQETKNVYEKFHKKENE